jgi:two-component system chemotaxis sensor kinase CheA
MTDPHKEFMRKLQETFRTEAEEHLQEIVSNIVHLEQANDAVQAGLAQRVLKALHTFKGAARAVNLAELETLCHAMESVFSAVASTGSKPTPEQFDLLHQAAGVARQLVQEPSGRIRNQSAVLAARLDQAGAMLLGGAPVMPHEAHAPVAATAPPAASGDDGPADAKSGKAPRADVIRVTGKHLDAIRYQTESLLAVDLGLQHHIAELLELAEEMASQREHEHGTELSARRQQSPDSGMPRFEAQCRRLADGLIRTRRNFAGIRTRLTDALLEAALVPFSSALDQLPALVRNLARSRGKEAVLDTEGGSIQIDRRILDVVRDALMHLVTNAVDHGIEPADQRRAAGKSAAGQIRIKVLQHGGDKVTVTIADDGAGIDVDGVVQAALREGSLGLAQAESMATTEKLLLALHAGVSTSAEVTQVSGRGMGLAIVAEKVASVGGELQIDSAAGSGSRFELRLPVRLATVRGLVVRLGDVRYVCPLAGIDAVRALEPGDIKTVQNRETLALEQRVLPAVRLAQLLGIDRAASQQEADGIALIARAGGNTFALLVDEIIAEQEVLPKSLGKQLRKVRYITGATQLGDGSLVPVVGLDDIARHALAGADGMSHASRTPSGAPATKRVLVVEDSITSRLLLKHILEGAGYHVETAVDGVNALSKLRQQDFDVVISDVEMPHMDGLALTQSIRANPKTEELPVVLVTSLQSPAERERGLQAGADAYVTKGAFDQDNLLATVRRLT